MRITFLFWNLKELPLQATIAELAIEHQVSVLLLVECTIDPDALINELESVGLHGFTYPRSPAGASGDIRIFVRFPRATVRPLFDDVNNHVSVRRFAVDGAPDFLVVVVHSQSKRNWSDKDQAQGAVRLARRIEEKESRYGHRRTILVGDLNMNPFEDGVVGSEGLHAVMTKQTARAGSRVVDAETRPFFYNPMWRFFGDHGNGPPGTHYFAASGKPVAYFWNIFDQVLVRPELMDTLSDVKILDRVGNTSLLDADGRPDTTTGSDHLPVLFALNF